MTPEEKAMEFLRTTQVEKMSGYISPRLYNTFEFVSKHKTFLEILTDYNSYRNGIYQNFGQRSIHELVAVLFNLFSIMVPNDYFFEKNMPIEISTQNVLRFFVDKNKFK